MAPKKIIKTILKANGKIVKVEEKPVASNLLDPETGKKIGLWCYYAAAGKNANAAYKLKEGSYVDGKRDGHWDVYNGYNNKKPILSGEYKDGVPVGNWVDHDNEMVGPVTMALKPTGFWHPVKIEKPSDKNKAIFKF